MAIHISLTLSVTDDAIASAERRNASRCMIAQALRLQGFTSVAVTAETVRFNDPPLGKRYFFPLPAAAAVKLRSFDRGRKIAPWRLRLQHGFTADIERRAPRGSHARYRKQPAMVPSAVRCDRRFHGLKVIKVAGEKDSL